MKINKVNCFNCIYFSVTWDPKTPKGCKFFGFKSENMPSATVYESTGKNCIAFEQKEVKPKK